MESGLAEWVERACQHVLSEFEGLNRCLPGSLPATIKSAVCTKEEMTEYDQDFEQILAAFTLPHIICAEINDAVGGTKKFPGLNARIGGRNTALNPVESHVQPPEVLALRPARGYGPHNLQEHCRASGFTKVRCGVRQRNY